MVQKIVINARHGGFGLSDAAVRRYADLKGLTLYLEEGEYFKLTGYDYWIVPEEERTGILTTQEFHKSSLEDREKSNTASSKARLTPREIGRDDPVLLKVVKELGASANGKFANLQIVEIPGDVNWCIKNYDGWEHVAEVHRTWSAEGE